MVTRRDLLLRAAAAPALAGLPLFARGRIDKSRISAITDEIGLTPDDAIAFAKQYGLKWVELRAVPGVKPSKEYAFMSEAELKELASNLAQNGLRVSFINTPLLKFGWPGTEPLRKNKETDEAKEKRQASEQKRWDHRKEDVEKAVFAAKILGCDKIRIFTGSRVADPMSIMPRVAEELNALLPIASKEKVHLLVENENSQNVGTAAEMAALMELMPSPWIGLNWDPHNAQALHETVFPDGYRLLPKKRILNIQFKGKGIMPESPEKQDWAAIIAQLNKDGYAYEIGLETHLFDGTLIQAAHTSMETMLRIVG